MIEKRITYKELNNQQKVIFSRADFQFVQMFIKHYRNNLKVREFVNVSQMKCVEASYIFTLNIGL